MFEKLGRKLNRRDLRIQPSKIQDKENYKLKAGKKIHPWNSFLYYLKKIPGFEIYTIIFLIYMFAPALIIIFFSFNAGRAPTLPVTGFTLNWYKTILTDSNFQLAIRNSLIIAVLVSIGAGIIGTAAAFAFKRFEFKFKNTAHYLLIFPITIPGLLLGISLLSFFVLLKIPLNLGTVILGHLVFTIPFVYLNVGASLENFNETIEEAARDLGANSFKVFLKITLPIIKSGIIGGMLIAFALSFDEFIVTFFIIGGGQNTVPMLIFSMLRRGIKPTINAISSLVLIASFIFISIANRVTRLKVRL
jgi:spermidine/putrescine transport system permease protein